MGRRLSLHEGPIDLVIEAWGPEAEVAQARRQAVAAFDGLLAALARELPLLRQPASAPRPLPEGAVARRMVAAVWPHRGIFITPMAAVAGAIADHILEALVAGRRLDRALVNDGGDIALYLGPGQSLTVGMVADLERPRIDARLEVTSDRPTRGIATSGRGGRSFSLGIADAVTVLAADAALADAAATVIANAVDLDHPAVRRCPASALDPDSDLGDRLVTVGLGPLASEEVDLALAAGAAKARELCAAGLAHGAALWLRGRRRMVGDALRATYSPPSHRMVSPVIRSEAREARNSTTSSPATSSVVPNRPSGVFSPASARSLPDRSTPSRPSGVMTMVGQTALPLDVEGRPLQGHDLGQRVEPVLRRRVGAVADLSPMMLVCELTLTILPALALHHPPAPAPGRGGTAPAG